MPQQNLRQRLVQCFGAGVAAFVKTRVGAQGVSQIVLPVRQQFQHRDGFHIFNLALFLLGSRRAFPALGMYIISASRHKDKLHLLKIERAPAAWKIRLVFKSAL